MMVKSLIYNNKLKLFKMLTNLRFESKPHPNVFAIVNRVALDLLSIFNKEKL